MKKSKVSNKTMTVDDYMNLHYPIIMTKTDCGEYLVEVPDLPGCFSSGNTQEEAFEMIEDVMRCWIAEELEYGKEVPLPEVTSYSGNILVRTTGSIHERLVKQARLRNKSLNAYVCGLLSEIVTLDMVTKRIDELDSTVRDLQATIELQTRSIAILAYRQSVTSFKPADKSSWGFVPIEPLVERFWNQTWDRITAEFNTAETNELSLKNMDWKTNDKSIPVLHMLENLSHVWERQEVG